MPLLTGCFLTAHPLDPPLQPTTNSPGPPRFAHAAIASAGLSSERILKLLEDRCNGGTAAALELAERASSVASQRAGLPPLIQQRDQNRAALALLVGRTPEHTAVHGGSM